MADETGAARAHEFADNTAAAASALGALVAVVGPLAIGIKLCADVFANLQARVAAQAKEAEAAAKALAKQATAAEDAYLKARAYGGATPQLAQKATEARAAADKAAAVAADGAGAGLLSLGAKMGIASAAVTAVVAGFSAALSVTKQWAGALAPGLVQQFDRSIRDVQATLGQAFTGIFDQGINFLQKLAGYINPVMQQLKPIVDQLAGSSLQILNRVIQSLVISVAQSLPILEAFAWVVDLCLRPIVLVMDAFNALGKATALAAAKLALLAGLPDFAKKLAASVTPTSGQSAAGPVSIKGLEQIGKDLAEASINAAGSDVVKTDPNAEVVNAIKEQTRQAKENNDNLIERLTRGVAGNTASAAVKAAEFFVNPLAYAVSH